MEVMSKHSYRKYEALQTLEIIQLMFLCIQSLPCAAMKTDFPVHVKLNFYRMALRRYKGFLWLNNENNRVGRVKANSESNC